LDVGARDAGCRPLAPQWHDDPAHLSRDVVAAALLGLLGIGADRLYRDEVFDDGRNGVGAATLRFGQGALFLFAGVRALGDEGEPAPRLLSRFVERDRADAAKRPSCRIAARAAITGD
jgi:hypothetical protein